MGFLHKSVGDEDATFGSDLKDLRELHAITFDEACRETKIDASILAAFEEDRIGDLEDPIFAERHLLAYVRYLGGHEPYFKARYAKRLAELRAERTTEELLPRTRRVRFRDLFVAPQFIAFAGIVVFACLLASYVLLQAYMVNTPPPLTITHPTDGARVERPRVSVEGQTIPEAYVTVNDRDAAVDEEGRFRLELDLRRGTTVITVIARRRRGSETVLERRVIFDREVTDIPSAAELFATSTEDGTASSTEMTTSTEDE